MSQTLDQRRAKHAWNAMTSAKRNLDDTKFAKYKVEAKKLPTRIVTSGLGPAIAFLNAKEKIPVNLAISLGDWVLDKRRNANSDRPEPAKDDLLKSIIGGDSESLRSATNECLAYLQWLNRFVEAEGVDLTDDNI